jgi:hypothetical protein
VSPENVPAELVQKATQAFAATIKATWNGPGSEWSITVPEDAMARALAAVLPHDRTAALEALHTDLEQDYVDKAPLRRLLNQSYREGWLDGHDVAGSRLLEHLKAAEGDA